MIMKNRTEKFHLKVRAILMCPICRSSDLTIKESEIRCNSCMDLFPVKGHQPDFRLRSEKRITQSFVIGTEYKLDQLFLPLRVIDNPRVDFSGMKVPKHLTRELLSHFPKGNGEDSCALDLGCGNGVHKEVVEKAGFIHVGFDYDTPQADIIGDAHSLPFQDASFDFVLSMAVLEHIQNPFIFSSEVYRVLKPGGRLIGSVAFLEGFHSHSYYHHTHYGTFNTLQTAGFKKIIVSPNPNWHVLRAQAKYIFPFIPVRLARALVKPMIWLHRILWQVIKIKKGASAENQRILMVSASFFFIAEK